MATKWVCGNCGTQLAKPSLPCPQCGALNPEEGTAAAAAPRSARGGSKLRNRETFAPPPAPLQRLDQVEAAGGGHRLTTGIVEFDRVLGGGLMPGSILLLAGEPGSGKSSLLLSAAAAIGQNAKVIYISAEESSAQIKDRADRFGVAGELIGVMGEAELGNIIAMLEVERPALAIIDSINAIYDARVEGIAGSPSQVKECASALMRLAKDPGGLSPITVVLVGHVTKDAAIAGPKTLEHMVDATLLLEGDRHGFFRMLRAVKNRFGSTNEVGIFEMGETGLAGVDNPASVLREAQGLTNSGRVLCPVLEGSRPLLVEVQALVSESSFSQPRRVADGIEYNRLVMLLAVLDKFCGLKLKEQDVYVKVGGGLNVSEQAIDAAVVLAVASSYREKEIDPHLAAVGDVGLGGELRPVGAMSQRVRDASRQDVRKLLLPTGGRPFDDKVPGISLVRVKNIRDLLEAAGLPLGR